MCLLSLMIASAGALSVQNTWVDLADQEEIRAAAGTEPRATQNPEFERLQPPADLAAAKRAKAPRNISQGYYIIVRKGNHTLSLYLDGLLLKSYPVGTGKHPGDKIRPQDPATPEGYFSLQNVHNAGGWLYTPPGGGPQARNVYGPWFLRLDTSAGKSFSGKGWTGIGIHGTNKPESIGHDVSLGCIRMHNADVSALKLELDKAKDIAQVQVDVLP